MQYPKDVDKHEGCDVEIGTLMLQLADLWKLMICFILLKKT